MRGHPTSKKHDSTGVVWTGINPRARAHPYISDTIVVWINSTNLYLYIFIATTSTFTVAQITIIILRIQQTEIAFLLKDFLFVLGC